MRSHLSKITKAALASFAFAVVLGVAASSAHAQTDERQRQQTQPPSPSASPSTATQAEADLSITARVTARELRFEKVPNPKVEFTGRPRRETVWEAERENLPAEVQPGVTYRDIGITLRITSVFADIERIVAEALGEVPLTDDAPPPTQQPGATPQTPPPPEASTPSSPAPSPATNSTTRPRRRQTRGGRGK